ncbi:MAG: arsenite methyltransferase [Bacteroidia bacterium]|nr:arsenite methyltransferase [Bacteroidia bacterium]
MKNSEEIKTMVQQKYAEIAEQSKTTNATSCCGSGGCSTEVYNIMNDEYTSLEGYNPDADLGLGCGLPTEFAGINKGDTVVDLGSGAGNDCFIARAATGAEGKVIGIDFTPAMIEKARVNADKLGFNNVEFKQGDIEKLPLTSCIADVVISNCVLNLVPDKASVFKEIKRVLKPGGHFSISDIVLDGYLPDNIRQSAEMYAGCISGAMQKNDYLQLISAAGFLNIAVQKEKKIIVPDDILKNYLSEEEMKWYHEKQPAILSITVYAEKQIDNCCN